MKEIEEDGEMRRQRPASPAVGAAFRVVGLALLLVPPLACRQVPGRPSAPASVVSGGELQLVVSRLPGEPRRFVSAKGRVPVRILVDPELADVEEISSYVLWVAREEVRPASRTAALTARISPKNPATSAKKSRARGRTARGRRGAKAKPKPPPPVYSWKEIASSTAGETLVIVRLADGIHGLRASVIYKDGRRLLAPRRGDAPIAFLRVDTQPPELEWLEPVAKSGRQGDVLELRWSTQDVHFGRRPLVIERSVDRGESWQEIARQQAVAGISSYRWKLPRDRPEEVLFRARTWDAAGNKASALLPWRSAEAPEVATSAGGTSGSPASVVPSPAAAGESSPGADGSPGVDGGETGPSRGLRLGPILLDGFETTCLRGGSVEELSWSIIDAEVDAKTSIVLEYRFSAEDGGSSGDGGDRSSGDGSSGDGGWQVGCEGTLGDRALSWTLPATRSGECRVRLALRSPGKSQLSQLSPLSQLLALPDPLTIDSEAPRAQFAELPSRLPAEARLGFTVEEQGCGGLRAARVYLRGEGADEWTALPEESVALAADDLSIDLRSLEEGTYELFVALEDAVGNRGEEPGTETKAQGRFALDKSPPRVDGKLTAAPWVGGFRGEVLVDLDVADCVPPLVVEGREAADNAGADWTELLRLASLALPQGTVSFPVPSTAKSYEIRVSVQDAAGNWAHQRLGPRPVEPPIRFVGFRENEVLLSRSREKILWSLHPTAEEYLDELRVSLEFLARTADEWLMLRDDLKADEAFYWQVPAADPQEHRLRLRLFRRNDIVGEDVSAAFRIAPIDGDVIARSLGPALPAGLSKASLTALEAADTEYTRYREASVGPGSVSAAQLDGLLQRARRAYEKAIELDDKNHGATFGLAQLLENADPERFRQESLELLKKTVAIEANHPLALNDLGAAYIREGEYLEAEPYLRNSLKARPTAKAYYNLGLALLFQGKGEAAREQFELALRKEDPALPEGDVYYYVVYTYLVEERVDDARDSYLSKRSVIPVELQRDLDQRLR